MAGSSLPRCHARPAADGCFVGHTCRESHQAQRHWTLEHLSQSNGEQTLFRARSIYILTYEVIDEHQECSLVIEATAIYLRQLPPKLCLI